MEMLWYRIAVGQVVEEHPRYEIRRVYEGLNRFTSNCRLMSSRSQSAPTGNLCCLFTQVGTYLGSPLYALICFDSVSAEEEAWELVNDESAMDVVDQPHESGG